MKNTVAIININTGSNVTTCTHRLKNTERGKVLNIDVKCDNVDEFAYKNSSEVLKDLFKGFNEIFKKNDR